MDNIFTFDFSNLLKKVQPTPLKIAISMIITFSLTSIAEIQFFFVNYTKYDIIGCKLPNNSTSSYTLNNCFGNDAKDLTLTNCLDSFYNTGSNYSLEFKVPVLGVEGYDKYSKVIFGFAFIAFLGVMGMLQVANYLQFRKRKRIQDVLCGSMVFIEGKNTNEKFMYLYLVAMTFIYLGLKILWIFYRSNIYDNIKCNNDIKYSFQLQQGLSTSIGVIFQTLLTCLLLPIVYVITSVNYLGDIDMKSIMTNLTNESLKQFKHISILKVELYNKILKDYVYEKYSNQMYILKFLRIHSFSCGLTSTHEIIQLILQHKNRVPQDFDIMLYNESKISIKMINEDQGVNNDKEKLIYK